jgi:HPt (histidine-containing phosphotransfer) domain-containing protein
MAHDSQDRDPPSAGPTGNSLEARLAELRRRYAAGLPEHLDALGGLLAEARDGHRGALSEARGLAHRLFGTSGSYGFAEVSAALEALESLLLRLSEDGRAAPEQGWAEASALLRRARTCIEGDSARAGG